MADTEQLRPVERRIRRLVEAETPRADIAQRFRRTPEFVDRVIEWSDLAGRTVATPSSARLRPLERRILRWRDEGATPAEIGPRFHRSPDFVERIETIARYKLTH
jgi:hypothetical protein